MRSALEMLLYAVKIYVASLTFVSGAVWLATWELAENRGDRRIAAILARGEIRSQFLGRSRLVVRSAAGAGRRDLAMLRFLIVAICFTTAVAVPLSIASQGYLSDRVLLPASAILGLAVSGTAWVYVASGGRRSSPIFPVLDLRPWVIDNQIRIRAAAAVARLVLIDEMIVLLAFVAAATASSRVTTGSDGGMADPIEVLYLIGAVIVGLLAWLLRRLIPWAAPRLAAIRLLMQSIDRRTVRAAGPSLRDTLMGLCRLMDRYAVVASRREAAARVQSPHAVVLRSVAANLRAFLSNRVSAVVRLEAVRSDLVMVAAFLCHPASAAMFDTLAARMHAFTSVGEPHEDYRSETPGRFVVGTNRLLVGLERTHQGFTRTLAIIALVTVLVLLGTGAIKLPDVIKVVKL